MDDENDNDDSSDYESCSLSSEDVDDDDDLLNDDSNEESVGSECSDCDLSGSYCTALCKITVSGHVCLYLIVGTEPHATFLSLFSLSSTKNSEDCPNSGTDDTLVAGRYSHNLITSNSIVDFICTGTV